MSRHVFHRTTGLALAAALVVGAGLVAQAQHAARADEQTDEEERIVAIAPDADFTAPLPEEGTRVVQAPAYWIGVAGEEVADPALRTQLQLAADTGVIIQQIVPDSPAEKAGLRKHDIIIAVDGNVAHGMAELVDAVRSGEGKPIELKVLRLAKEETITVKPEERPAAADQFEQPLGRPGQPPMGLGGELGDLQRRLQGLIGEPGELGMRILGPGVVLRQHQGVDVPAGVSVSVTRQGDGPAQITVQRGDESWTVTEGDEEGMDQLPDDVRPFVEQMLGGHGHGGPMQFHFDMSQLQELLPDHLGNFDANDAAQRAREAADRVRARAERTRAQADAQQEQMLQRMRQMEERLRQMQEQMENLTPPEPVSPPAPSADDHAT